jgi:uncharacterized SAM-binding protein YcdF (DUF218 family)
MDEVFFLISKLGWAIVSPGNLIIILMTFATIMLLLNNVTIGKWILTPPMIANFLLMVYPVSDSLLSPLETRFSKPIPLPQNIDGIIVLGGGEKLKQSLSWHTQELGNAGDRFIGAAVLAKYYPNAPIIYSGGSKLLRPVQNGKNEVNIAQKLLTAIGISKDRLIIESQSRNTAENFLFMKRKLLNLNGAYLLVTSAFHMPRAVGVARQQSINVIAYLVDYMTNNKQLRQWGFDYIGHLEILNLAWHEWLGLTAYYWTGRTSEWLPRDISE